MSKILDRDRKFDTQRRKRTEPGWAAPNDPASESPSQESGQAVAVEDPVPVTTLPEPPPAIEQQAANPLPIQPVKHTRRGFRRILILLLISTALVYRFQLLAPTTGPIPETRGADSVRAKNNPQPVRSFHFFPPRISFPVVGALDERTSAPAAEFAALPTNLRPLSVSAPLSLVPSQEFVELAAPADSEPASAPQPEPEPEVSPPALPPIESAPNPTIDPVSRTLQLMDEAAASAARAASDTSSNLASESKKPGD